jgi:peptidoglycan LD-endopeptidase CwlK
MIVLGLVVYMGIAIGIAWLLLFPRARERCFLLLQRAGGMVGAGIGRFGQRSAGFAGGSAQAAHGLVTGSIQLLARHRYSIVASLILLSLPAVLVLSLRHSANLGGFDPYAHPANAVVEQLLRGEQLVPPPPLPPEVFVTPEVAEIRPALGDASRDWSRLDADFSQRLLHVIKIMHDRYGYDVVLLEGYRSPERQAMLARLGPAVTNAGAWQSYHQFGLAADCAFFRDGKLVISERDPWAMRGYQLYGQVAESLGLTWGGNWKLMDYGHVELHRVGRQAPIG